MAGVVIGIASSHTPQLSSWVGMWHDHVARDQGNPQLLGSVARFHMYSELLARSGNPGRASVFSRKMTE
jgi:hypothetical protein